EVALVHPGAIALLAGGLDENTGFLQGLDSTTGGGLADAELLDGEGHRHDGMTWQQLEEAHRGDRGARVIEGARSIVGNQREELARGGHRLIGDGRDAI